MGEIMMAYLCYYKKIAGIVLDGPIRDITKKLVLGIFQYLQQEQHLEDHIKKGQEK